MRWPAVWDGSSRGPARLAGLPDIWPLPRSGQPLSVVAEDERGGLLDIHPARLPPRDPEPPHSSARSNP